LDVDDQPRLRQLSPQSLVLAGELGHPVRLGDGRIGLAAALARKGVIGGRAVLAPCRQLRGIDAFTTQ
jgi:hypothetical protein